MRNGRDSRRGGGGPPPRRQSLGLAAAAAVVLLGAGLLAGAAACGGSSGSPGSGGAPNGGTAAQASPAAGTASPAAGTASPAADTASAAAGTASGAAGVRPVVGPDGGVVPGADVVYKDLAYDVDSPLQKLDLYLPDEDERPFPLLVAIHGGGFSSGDKADGQLIPVLSGLTRGYAVASLDYRLSPQATFPAAINDVKAAVRWLRAHAGEYGLDGSRVALWGDSAGGNLAALAGTTGDTEDLRGPDPVHPDQPDTVQAVVDWFGPISFLRTDGDFREAGFDRVGAAAGWSFLAQYLGAPLDEVRGRVRASDPITYLTHEDPPILIEHGTADGTVPYPQSVRLAKAYAKVAGAGRVTLNLLRGAGHVDAVFYSREHLREVLDWLDERLR